MSFPMKIVLNMGISPFQTQHDTVSPSACSDQDQSNLSVQMVLSANELSRKIQMWFIIMPENVISMIPGAKNGLRHFHTNPVHVEAPCCGVSWQHSQSGGPQWAKSVCHTKPHPSPALPGWCWGILTMRGPQRRAKLVYNFNIYGLWYF